MYLKKLIAWSPWAGVNGALGRGVPPPPQIFYSIVKSSILTIGAFPDLIVYSRIPTMIITIYIYIYNINVLFKKLNETNF